MKNQEFSLKYNQWTFDISNSYSMSHRIWDYHTMIVSDSVRHTVKKHSVIVWNFSRNHHHFFQDFLYLYKEFNAAVFIFLKILWNGNQNLKPTVIFFNNEVISNSLKKYRFLCYSCHFTEFSVKWQLQHTIF